MNESSPAVVPAGKISPLPGNGDPVADLKARHSGLTPGTEPRRGPGRPKRISTPPGAAAPAANPPPVAPLFDKESFCKKMGMVHALIGNGLALSTNCNVFILSDEDRKILGDAYGELLIGLGFTDSLALAGLVAVGSTVSIYGGKFAAYKAYMAHLAAEAEALNKNPSPSTKPSGAVEAPGGAQVAKDGMFESKPGVI